MEAGFIYQRHWQRCGVRPLDGFVHLGSFGDARGMDRIRGLHRLFCFRRQSW